jgi:hypothetical protein
MQARKERVVIIGYLHKRRYPTVARVPSSRSDLNTTTLHSLLLTVSGAPVSPLVCLRMRAIKSRSGEWTSHNSRLKADAIGKSIC